MSRGCARLQVYVLDRRHMCARSHIIAPELPQRKQVSDGQGQQADVKCARSWLMRSIAGALDFVSSHLIGSALERTNKD